MIIAIEASSAVDGGSQTHLVEVLKNFSNKFDTNIKKVIIISNSKTLSLINDTPYIIKYTNKYLNSNFLIYKIWVNLFLNKYLRNAKCDILLDISGTYIGKFHPFVGMSRNMLLFEKNEVARFNSIYQTFRFNTLRYLQIKSFNKSDGIIFISKYAKHKILQLLNPHRNWTIIHHGVSKLFTDKNKIYYPSTVYNESKKFRILYVSNILPFKHHFNVINAVSELNNSKNIFELILVGGVSKDSYCNKFLNLVDSCYNVIYKGKLNYSDMTEIYKSADLFVFASTCENMPNTLIEAMSSGLPVLCSNYGPMPEFGGNAVEYFEPTEIESLKNALTKVFYSQELRMQMSKKSQKLTEQFSWEKCSYELFNYLIKIHINFNSIKK